MACKCAYLREPPTTFYSWSFGLGGELIDEALSAMKKISAILLVSDLDCQCSSPYVDDSDMCL